MTFQIQVAVHKLNTNNEQKNVNMVKWNIKHKTCKWRFHTTSSYIFVTAGHSDIDAATSTNCWNVSPRLGAIITASP